MEIMAIVTRCIGKDGMAQGQALDLEFAGRAGTIVEIHRLKTAELIKGSLLAAAVAAGFDGPPPELLARAGIALGMGFQLADDLLDITGDEDMVGKKLRKDQRQPAAPTPFCISGWRRCAPTSTRIIVRRSARVGELGIDFPPFLSLMKSMLYRSQ